MSLHRHDCRVSLVIFRRSEAPSAVRGFGDFPAVDLPDGRGSPRHGAVVRGQTQKFLTPAAKTFASGTSLPWTTETGFGRVCTPGKFVCGEQAAVRRQTGRDNCAIRRSCLTHRKMCREPASGATGENRRHNNGMWWSLAHHSRTGENRENRTTSATKKVKIFHFFKGVL